MKCFSEKTYLMFLDNELDGEKFQEMASHVDDCRQCQNIIENLKQENEWIRKGFDSPCWSGDLSDGVMNQILSKKNSSYSFSSSCSSVEVDILNCRYFFGGDFTVFNASHEQTPLFTRSKSGHDSKCQCRR